MGDVISLTQAKGRRTLVLQREPDGIALRILDPANHRERALKLIFSEIEEARAHGIGLTRILGSIYGQLVDRTGEATHG